MRFQTLNEWLTWQEQLHPRAIDLGLDRVKSVLARMNLAATPYAVITVAGTNGKGSCAVYLEAILAAAGYRIGTYLSPHLLRYNERIRVAGVEADDATICAAFERVDNARGSDSLTYFEFGTLAALDVFRAAGVKIAVLEVGLGGRLDAVNAVDPVAGLITSIGVDHVDWLGAEREAIGLEKAGIFRPGRPAVCGDPQPPESVTRHARDIGAPLMLAGRDYRWDAAGDRWHWRGREQHYRDLPLPALPGDFQLQNAAAVLATLETLSRPLPVTEAAVRKGLVNASLPGRLQLLPDKVPVLLDVAHNPDAARRVAEYLHARPAAGRTRAVVGMYRDKDTAGLARVLDTAVHDWYAATLDSERGLPAAELADRLTAAGVTGGVRIAGPVAEAYRLALAEAMPDDRIVVLGSFQTVGAVLQAVTGS